MRIEPSRQHRPRQAWQSAGFTLVEILIVVMILAILASIVIPRYTSASDQARGAAITDQLRLLREQIEVYRAQHDRLPGCTAGVPLGNATLFTSHLTGITDAAGNVATARDATHRFGPYLLSIPVNSISDLGTVKLDMSLDAVPTADGTTGWIFQPLTGRISINLGAQDASGKTYVSY